MVVHYTFNAILNTICNTHQNVFYKLSCFIQRSPFKLRLYTPTQPENTEHDCINRSTSTLHATCATYIRTIDCSTPSYVSEFVSVRPSYLYDPIPMLVKRVLEVLHRILCSRVGTMGRQNLVINAHWSWYWFYFTPDTAFIRARKSHQSAVISVKLVFSTKSFDSLGYKFPDNKVHGANMWST